MYRVVIVDDEEPVLDSFSFILEKEHDDFTLCGKARSGTEAIQIIRDLKPDIVFMDVQMPGIDGLDAISRVRAYNPETVFILATAYERFDIAQKAIPLGIFSYLVKPISRKMFINELFRVKIHLDRTRQGNGLQIEDIRFLQKTKEELKNRLLSNLFWKDPSPEDWESFSRLFSLKSDRGMIRLLDVCDGMAADGKNDLYVRLSEKIRFKFNCFHSVVTSRLVLYFPEDQELDRVDDYLDGILNEFKPVKFITGRGGVYGYPELSRSFLEAFEPFRSTSRAQEIFFAEKETVRHICSAILRSDFRTALPLFDEFWMKIFQEDAFEVAKGKMTAFFTMLFSNLDNSVLSAGYLDVNPAEKIMSIATVEAWRVWAQDMMGRLQRTLDTYEARPIPRHLKKALALIREKYNQPVQLSSIAEECRISTSYLCRLFSEYMDTSFIEYLNRYRIEQAVVLLRDKNLSIKETSILVGYQDSNYFSRIFRRYMGLSPSELVNRRIRDDG